MRHPSARSGLRKTPSQKQSTAHSPQSSTCCWLIPAARGAWSGWDGWVVPSVAQMLPGAIPNHNKQVPRTKLCQFRFQFGRYYLHLLFERKEKKRSKKEKPDILRERSEASDGLILPVCVSAPQRGENVLLISRPPGEYADLITSCSCSPAAIPLAQDIS